MSKKKSTVELPKPHPTRTKSRPLEFLKHTQQLVDLYPKMNNDHYYMAYARYFTKSKN